MAWPANSPIEAKADEPEAVSPEPATPFRLSASLADTVEQCWRKAAVPEEWNLARELFVAALERSVAHRFAAALPAEREIHRYLETLQVFDLALTVACSAGNAAAWEFFVRQFRPELHRAAGAITGGRNAHELADSLYADLYGLRDSHGRRKSLFDYFHGRSKLGTWLRAVLAQRHVDEMRRVRKTEPFEQDPRAEVVRAEAAVVISGGAALDTERAKYIDALQATLTATLGSLDPRDRLRLAYYYVDARTLAEIGRLFGEHEATVSRKLERTRRDVRARVESALRQDKKWTAGQVQLCFEYARGEWPFDLSETLRAPSSSLRPSAEPDAASAEELGD
jgi:RNA polymerase sigma-70 factor